MTIIINPILFERIHHFERGLHAATPLQIMVAAAPAPACRRSVRREDGGGLASSREDLLRISP